MQAGAEITITGGKYNGKQGKIVSVGPKTCRLLLVDGTSTGNICQSQLRLRAEGSTTPVRPNIEPHARQRPQARTAVLAATAPALALSASLVPRRHQVWVLFDLETTGFSWRKADITQVAFRVLRWRPATADYERTGKDIVSFVRTHKRIPMPVQELTGIRPADVRAAPTFGDVCDRLRAVIAAALADDCSSGDSIDRSADVFLVAHNGIKFDCPFLYRYLARQFPTATAAGRGGLAPLLPTNRSCRVFAVDTMKMAKHASFVPAPADNKLGTLHKFVTGRPIAGAHRADADVDATEAVFRDERMQAVRFHAAAVRSERDFLDKVTATGPAANTRTQFRLRARAEAQTQAKAAPVADAESTACDNGAGGWAGSATPPFAPREAAPPLIVPERRVQNDDGTWRRPPGRARTGYSWNSALGAWTAAAVQ